MIFLTNKLYLIALLFACLLGCPVFANTYVCPDLQGDGVVDLQDFAELAESWLQSGPDLSGDIIFDGTVDFADIEYLSGVWLDSVACSVPKGAIHVSGTIAKMKKLVPQSGDIAVVAGYYESKGGGGGTFVYDSDSTASDDGGAVIKSDYVPGRWLRQFDGQVNVKDFGAKGDNSTDDTVTIRTAVSYAYRSGVPIVFLPSGTYKISNTIYMTNDEASDFPPSLIGCNVGSSRIISSSSFPAGSPLIDFRGNGQLSSHAKVSGIRFTGRGVNNGYNEVGIRLRGTKGLLISECQLDALQYAVRFHNTDSGVATEYNVVKNCNFEMPMATTLHYYRTGSTSAWSFRGDGIAGSSITHTTDNIPAYYVEDISGQSEKALVYDAPMEITSFGGGSRILFQSNVNSDHRIYGAFREEGELTTIAGGSGKLIIDDYMITLGEIIPGTLQSKGILSIYGPASGAHNGSRITWHATSKWSQTLVSGSTTVDGQILGGVMYSLSSLFFVVITGPDYDYRYLVVGTHNPGTLNVINTIKTYNGSGAGAPQLTINSAGLLVITNYSYNSNYTAVVYETPLGSDSYAATN
jgi:hypothetical protein